MGRPPVADAPIASKFGVGKSPGHPSDPAMLDETVRRLIRAIFLNFPSVGEARNRTIALSFPPVSAQPGAGQERTALGSR